MTLNYKASNIAKAEREENNNFFNAFTTLGSNGAVSVSDLLFIWHCGGGDDASFDETFDKGIPALMETIMEGINEAGFLGAKMDTKEMRKLMEEAMAQATETLPTTGASNKQ